MPASVGLNRLSAESTKTILIGINHNNMAEIAHIQWYPGPALKEIQSTYPLNSKFLLLGFSNGGTFVMQDPAARSHSTKAAVVCESGGWPSSLMRRERAGLRTGYSGHPISLSCATLAVFLARGVSPIAIRFSSFSSAISSGRSSRRDSFNQSS